LGDEGIKLPLILKSRVFVLQTIGGAALEEYGLSIKQVEKALAVGLAH
jgi:hypothetical protein